MFNRVDQLIDFEAFLQLRCTEMLLIHNSNGKLENVKAVVGQVAVRHSLHELESLSDFKIEFRWKMIIDNINVQVLFSSPPSVIYFILPVELVSFKKHDAVLNLVLSSPFSQHYIWPSPH